MDDPRDLALLDTSRDELRRRISAALQQFDHLIRTADPKARPRGSDWTVQQIAHVLTVGHRYTATWVEPGTITAATPPGK